MSVKLRSFEHPDALAEAAAAYIAEIANESIEARGRFVWAVSGGRSPRRMLHCLAKLEVEWPNVWLFQVDERVAPDGHEDRNWTMITDILLSQVDIPRSQVFPMPVQEKDLQASSKTYGSRLLAAVGNASGVPRLDLAQLGLGADGHTASLIPGDAVVHEVGAWVAPTGVYQGRSRMTLTRPVLDAAHALLFVVEGPGKEPAVEKLVRQDASIPAGQLKNPHTMLWVSPV